MLFTVKFAQSTEEVAGNLHGWRVFWSLLIAGTNSSWRQTSPRFKCKKTKAIYVNSTILLIGDVSEAEAVKWTGLWQFFQSNSLGFCTAQFKLSTSLCIDSSLLPLCSQLIAVHLYVRYICLGFGVWGSKSQNPKFLKFYPLKFCRYFSLPRYDWVTVLTQVWTYRLWRGKRKVQFCFFATLTRSCAFRCGVFLHTVCASWQLTLTEGVVVFTFLLRKAVGLLERKVVPRDLIRRWLRRLKMDELNHLNLMLSTIWMKKPPESPVITVNNQVNNPFEEMTSME